MYETLLQAAIPVCSVIIGMFGQHYLSRTARREDTTRDKRLESYSSYVSSACRYALRNKAVRSDGHDARVELAAAKAQICIYGSGDVVRALAKFEANPTFSAPESRENFIKTIEAMRRDGCKVSTPLDELHWIIFAENQTAAE